MKRHTEDEMNQTGVYAIRNMVNNKRYVGSTACFRKRWYGHLRTLKNGRGNKHIQSDYNKYGPGVFVFEIVEICKLEHAADVEQVMIDFYRSTNRQFGYNIQKAFRPMLIAESEFRSLQIWSNCPKFIAEESFRIERLLRLRFKRANAKLVILNTTCCMQKNK